MVQQQAVLGSRQALLRPAHACGRRLAAPACPLACPQRTAARRSRQVISIRAHAVAERPAPDSRAVPMDAFGDLGLQAPGQHQDQVCMPGCGCSWLLLASTGARRAPSCSTRLATNFRAQANRH